MFKGKNKKLISWILTLAIILSNFSGLSGFQTVKADTLPNKVIDIIGITDFHGQLLDFTNTKPVGAALAKVVKDVKATNQNGTLIIGGGDLYQGTPVSNVLRGVPVQKVLSNLGMEVTALGNHEFDWGLDVVNNTTMTGANYSIVCANMYNKGATTRPYQPYKIITKNGVRIAVIGAILKDAPTIIMPAFVANYDFKDVATEINACAKEITDGKLADIILADVHDGGDSLKTMVNNLHGVNAVFGGHTHTSFDDVIKDADGKDVPTLNAASSGKGFADLKITVDSANKITGFSPKGENYKSLTTTTTSPVDAECKAIVDKASADLLPTFNEKIGTNATALTKDQVDAPYGESQLGNWMADVVKNTAKAEVGMVNNGGIRLSPIPAGDITVGTIFNIMPFDNIVTTVTMTGAQLKVLFEQAVADTTGKGLQISGVKFTYDSSKPSYKAAVKAAGGTITTPEVPGQRVTSIIRESDNSIVKDTDTLKVAAPDFVATGGDNFTEFTIPAIKATYVDSHILVRDALTDDVRAKGKITATMNNRIDNQVPVVTPPAATISVVATSDVHGNVLNFDYGTNAAPSKGQGLAKVSTYVKGLRVANPNVMLVDNGDTIQGTPLAYYYNMIDKTTIYPMSAVMGEMKYDAWTLGNHEFNYGLDTLNRIILDANAKNIHMLSANTYKSDGKNFVEPYTIKAFVVNGKTIKIAVLGLTTKTIPSWEDSAHYAGLHFNDLVDEAKKWVPIVKAAGADVVIVTAHTGEEGTADVIPENQAKALATSVNGIDAIVAGHAHSTLNDLTLKNPLGKVVPVIEPGKWAQNVAQIDIAIDVNGSVTGLNTKNVSMNTIAEDTAITDLIAPYQAKTLDYTATVLGQSTGEYKGDKQITEPTEIMELINKVQAKAANTQLSIAAPLSLSAHIPTGDITIKDIMGVYVFENFLYGVKMTGKQVKDWMEYTVRYYKQVMTSSDLIEKDKTLNIADYNLDQLYGASYDIDLTQAACTLDSNKRVISGNRINNLKFNGNVVKDSDVFTVAINNYRYNGGGGFMAAAGLSSTDQSIVTYDSGKKLGDDGQVRSLMMKYVQDNKTITPTTSNNWKLYTTTLESSALPEKITVTINGDSTTSKAFTWYTDKLTTGSQVQVVKKTSIFSDFKNAIEFNGDVEASSNASLVENAGSKDEVMHKAMAIGLKEDTQYSYRVGDKATDSWSTVGTFKTSPTGNKAFSFITLTDTQAADAAEAAISANTIDQALKTIKNAEFIVHIGDIVENGSIEKQWDWLLNASRSSLLNTTIMPAAGNHEAYNSASSAFVDHFNLPKVGTQDTSKGAYYSYDYGNAHFIVLNTNDNLSTGVKGELSQAQIDWLKADVAASNKEWKILSMHKGIYTTGKHLDDDDIIASRAQLIPIMDKLNIDIIFQGHDHTYSRSKFLASGKAQATTEITETLGGEQIKYAVNPTGKMYITVNAAGPKVYGLETSNTKVTLTDYFSLFTRNEQPALNPKYTPEANGDPKRGVVQQFAGITIDGNKLTYMAYKIEDGQTTLVDTYGIVKRTCQPKIKKKHTKHKWIKRCSQSGSR